MALEPDLVLTFSDLQATSRPTWSGPGSRSTPSTSARSPASLAMICTLGVLVGMPDRADTLAWSHEDRLAGVRASVPMSPRPRVWFEEWGDPLISGIGWVSELIEIAGGVDVFAHLRTCQAAQDRIVRPDAVLAAAPDVIIASWCGKKVATDRIRQRPGWASIPAVRTGRMVEIKSPLILQPGPAALTDGLDAIVEALAAPADTPERAQTISDRHRTS